MDSLGSTQIVINTHLHFDHCGWNTVRRNGQVEPTFPNAPYHVQRREWEHAIRQLERDRVSYISDNYDPLLRSGQMKLLQGDQENSARHFRCHLPSKYEFLRNVILSGAGRFACESVCAVERPLQSCNQCNCLEEFSA